MADGPLIVQSDKTLLLEVDHPQAEDCRRDIAPFAELERSPEHIHTYRVTPLALWNARAAGHDAEQVVDALLRYSRYPVPHALLVDVADTMDRYGRLRLLQHPVHGLVLETTDVPVLEEVVRHKKVQPLIGARVDAAMIKVHPSERGSLKQVLLKVGWPAEDLAGYVDGEHHDIALAEDGWTLRPYQKEAAEGFRHGGSGVIVLPCGAGKTIVGRGGHGRRVGDHADPGDQHRLGAPVALGAAQAHLADRGRDRRVLRRPQGDPAGHHRDLPGAHAQDEGRLRAPGAVRRARLGPDHLRRGPPAAGAGLPVHRRHPVAAAPGPDRHAGPRGRHGGRGLLADRAQALRRAVEGHRGPGLHRPGRLRRGPGDADRPRAADVRLLPSRRRSTGWPRPRRPRPSWSEALVERHAGEPTLVIGQYIDQLDDLGERLGAPVLKGSTPVKERERLYEGFRTGEIPCLVVSKVANFSVDLPEASVAIQVSGTFGSRQEEAQRLGRVLRPKADGRGARFYAVVSRDTVDQEFAAHRQRFLAEQGYAYRIVDADAVLAGEEI